MPLLPELNQFGRRQLQRFRPDGADAGSRVSRMHWSASPPTGSRNRTELSLDVKGCVPHAIGEQR